MLVALMAGGLLFASAAFADIMVGSSTTNVSNDVTYTQLTLNKPSDAAEGDLLLANVSVNGGYPAGITAPSGWTLAARTDNDTNVSIATYTKVVGASEPSSYTWTINPQARAVGGITRYSGVDTTNPIDVVGTSTGRGTTATAPSVTTTVASDTVVALFATNAGTTGSAPFSTTTGMTKAYDAKNTPFGPTTASEYVSQTTPGATGTKSVTVSTGPQRDWAAQTIALKMLQPDAVIALDATSSGRSFDTTLTVSHTISGTNRTLVVFVDANDFASDDVTSVTYNGISLTRVDAMLSTAGDGRYHYTYMLTNPPLGTHDIVVNETEARDAMWLLAASYTGTDQSGTPDAVGHIDSDPSSTFSPSLTTVANNAWLVIWGQGNGIGGADGYTAGPGTRFIIPDFGLNNYVADSDSGLSPGSNSLTFVRVTGSGGNDAMMISLAPAHL